MGECNKELRNLSSQPHFLDVRSKSQRRATCLGFKHDLRSLNPSMIGLTRNSPCEIFDIDKQRREKNRKNTVSEMEFDMHYWNVPEVEKAL